MSTEHPDLAAMVRGDLPNAQALEAASHARGCETCRAELVDVAVGHGLLTASSLTLGRALPDDLPPLAAPLREHQPGRSRVTPRRLLAVAAALAVMAGAGAGAAALLGGEDEPPPAAVERTARLEPIDPATTSRGQVTMGELASSTTRMTVDVGDLPEAGRGRFYYVWLLDPATNKMLPLGVVGPERPSSFEVPASLVEAYAAVDVSLEPDDGDPTHSAVSVLRATYADPPADS